MAVTKTFKAGEAHEASPVPLGYGQPVAEPEPEVEAPVVETAPEPATDGVSEAEEPTEESAPEPTPDEEEADAPDTPSESWTHAQIDAWADEQDPVVEYPRDANKADKLTAIDAYLEGTA